MKRKALAALPLAKEARAHLHPRHESFELCAYCPKMCRFSCPVAEADARETLTPWGKMSAPFLAMAPAGKVPLSAAFETSWACTGCGHCREYCVHDNDVPTSLAAVRAAGIAAGLASPVTDLVRTAYTKAGATLPSSVVPTSLRDDGRAPVVYLPGCSRVAAFDPAPVRAVVKLLEKLGGDIAISSHGECCGAALWWAGLPAEFDAHAARFVKSVSKRKRLIAADAGCAWALRVLYPQRGHTLAPEVIHASEWLAAFFRERVLKIRERVKGAFLYHDPCTLARDLEVVDEPRAVLASVLGAPFQEFAWNRRDAVCCGGGGLLPQSMPATASRMASARAAEAKAARAAVVTSCPSCLRQFRASGVEAHDLLTLAVRAL